MFSDNKFDKVFVEILWYFLFINIVNEIHFVTVIRDMHLVMLQSVTYIKIQILTL